MTANNVSSPPESNALRKSVLHLLIDLDLPVQSSDTLAGALSTVMGRRVSRNTLSMALSGYRSSCLYVEYLSGLKTYLEECRSNNREPVTLYTKNVESQSNQ